METPARPGLERLTSSLPPMPMADFPRDSRWSLQRTPGPSPQGFGPLGCFLAGWGLQQLSPGPCPLPRLLPALIQSQADSPGGLPRLWTAPHLSITVSELGLWERLGIVSGAPRGFQRAARAPTVAGNLLDTQMPTLPQAYRLKVSGAGAQVLGLKKSPPGDSENQLTGGRAP